MCTLLDPNDSLPQNLELFASSIYDIDDASFFVDFLQHELAQKVASLSLDELERLAGAIAQRKS